jgi:hypothetical protein
MIHGSIPLAGMYIPMLPTDPFGLTFCRQAGWFAGKMEVIAPAGKALM